MEDRKVLLPRIGVNDDDIYIGQWLIGDGEYVKENQPIAVLETSKETTELLAETEGFINIKVNAGEEKRVGTEIASISLRKIADHRKTIDERIDKLENRTFTKKAKEFIEKHPELDLSKLPVNEIIKEQDLINLISKPYQIAETMTNHVLIYGRGGFCKYAIDIINQSKVYQIDGILEFHYPDAAEIYGMPVIGNDDDLKKYYDEGYRKIINVVCDRDRQLYRKPPYEKLKQIGYETVNLVDRNACISPSVKMGEGNMICSGAYVGSDCIIGNNIIVNVNAVISHDCIISDHCHIASNAALASGVIVGENTLIGQGAVIYMGVKIGKDVVIYNGCSIFKDVPDGMVVEA